MKSKARLSILTALTIFAVSGCGNPIHTANKTADNTSSNTVSNTTDTTTVETAIPDVTNNMANGTANVDASSTPSPTKTEMFYGKWQLILGSASKPNGNTYSGDNWNAIKGKTLTFSKDSATCFGDKVEDINNTLPNPVYKQTVLSDQDFQSKYGVPLNKLPGIQGNSITEVDVTGTNGIGNVFFTTQYKNMLILYGGGQFFVLEPPTLRPSDVQAVNEPNAAWVAAFENKLFEEYRVIPSRYKSIGNGYWEVWVREVNTGDYPYVTVNQNTGDFHG